MKLHKQSSSVEPLDNGLSTYEQINNKFENYCQAYRNKLEINDESLFDPETQGNSPNKSYQKRCRRFDSIQNSPNKSYQQRCHRFDSRQNMTQFSSKKSSPKRKQELRIKIERGISPIRIQSCKEMNSGFPSPLINYQTPNQQNVSFTPEPNNNMLTLKKQIQKQIRRHQNIEKKSGIVHPLVEKFGNHLIAALFQCLINNTIQEIYHPKEDNSLNELPISVKMLDLFNISIHELKTHKGQQEKNEYIKQQMNIMINNLLKNWKEKIQQREKIQDDNKLKYEKDKQKEFFKLYDQFS